ncbi:MAG TPA: flavodoxin family protein [Firmicutes bacterium]|nr:flavodoxin family protein [Bacillota bacterium]
MAVRILGICGSPRKSVTEYCVREALKEAAGLGGVDTDFFTVRGLKYGFCVHCDLCLKKESLDCLRQKDDLAGFFGRFITYDGYIIGTPVYDMNMSSQLLTLINRAMRPSWLLLQKDPGFFYRKVGGAIAVGGTRNGGQEMALQAINNVFFSLGIAPVSGGVLAYNGASVWSKNIPGLKGAEQDPVGLDMVRALGRRVGLMAKALRPQPETCGRPITGEGGMEEQKRVTLAGTL